MKDIKTIFVPLAAFVMVLAASISIASCKEDNPDTVKTFTVIFNSNGGSTVTAQTVKESDRLEEPVEPIKVGNNFEGWYKESTLTNKWDFDTDMVTSSFTLFANWTPESFNTFTVTFESNGGSSVADRIVQAGERLSSPANPSKTGHRFAGWYKEASLINLWMFDIDVVNSNITLYAKWEVFDGVTVPFETREDVLKFLKNCASDGNILFGKHLEYRAGIDENKQRWWNSNIHTAVPTHGDTYRITGKQPAVLGMDVFEPFQANPAQPNVVNSMISTVKVFAGTMKGLIAISCHIENPWWHVNGRQGASYRYIDPNNPNVVRQILETNGPVQLKQGFTVKEYFDAKVDEAINAMLEMKLANGRQIPLMVRLFHENSREWFWWGDTRCSAAEYIALYKYTADRMKARVENLSFIYAPDRNWVDLSATGKYMDRYPGNDYVDILAYDDYFIINQDVFNHGGTYSNGLQGAITRLRALSQYANTHDKVVMLAETGLMLPGGVVTQNNWFTNHFYQALTAEGVNLSFFVIWSPWPWEDDSGLIFPYRKVSPEADNLRDFVSRDRIKMNDFMMEQ